MIDANKPFDISTVTIDKITPIGIYCGLIIVLAVIIFIYLSIKTRKETNRCEKVKNISVFVLTLMLISATSYATNDAFKERETLHTKEEFVKWAQQRYDVDVSSMPYKESTKETILGLSLEIGIEDDYTISTDQGAISVSKTKNNKLILVDENGSELPITITENEDRNNAK